MTVYNKRKGFPSTAIYVGRPTVYGNPFIVGVDGNRNECISLYRDWIMLPEQKRLRQNMQVFLRERDLVCWCAPLPCHADVIMEIANA